MLWKGENRWYVAESGFWKPGWHLVLEEGFDYPEQAIYLNQFTVIEADGKVSVYRNWFQDYNPESITEELEARRIRRGECLGRSDRHTVRRKH